MPCSVPSKRLVIGVLLPLALPAAVALAQDSIAPPAASGLPGDALDAYRTTGPSQQITDYVLDLAPIASSWGGRYAIGPIAKSSRSATAATANHLIAAQGLAASLIAGPLARVQYAAWSIPGAGINSQVNLAPSTIMTPTAVGQRSALAFVEYGAGPDALFATGDDEQNVIAATIDFQSRRPNRLFVSRIAAAHNKATSSTGNTATASFGLGAVDHHANVAFVADAFNILSPSRLTGRDYFRVAGLARDPLRVNNLQQSGAGNPGATTRVFETSVALTPPSLIPAAIAGRPVLFGAVFNADLRHESAPGVTAATRGYLPGGVGSPRGGVSFVPSAFAPVSNSKNDAGCGLILTRAPGDIRTRSISIFGVNTNGSVDAQVRISLPLAPGVLVDRADAFDPADHFPDLAGYDFTNVQSQSAFRGGAQIAAAVLPDADLIVAGAIQLPADGSFGSTLPQGMHNAIAVARVSHTDATVTWTLAAHTGDLLGAAGNLSKPLRGDFGADGIPATGDTGENDGVVDAAPIGRLALASELDPAATSGPSISSPAIDSDGNLYFVSCVRLNTIAGHVHTRALVRANLDPANLAYSLELLAQEGQVVIGVNSARPYRIASLPLADADSIDAGAIWAANSSRGRIDGVPDGTLPLGSPLSMSLLACRAKIVYDVNLDGVFADPEAATSPDQSYWAVLALMPSVAPADFNRDHAVDSRDFFAFLGVFFSGGAAGDYDGDGSINSQDFFAFLADFFIA